MKLSQYFFNLWAIPYFASFFVSFIIAWILFFKKRNSTKVRLFILAQFLNFILSLASAMASCSLSPDVWVFWFSIIWVFSILSVTTQFHFSSIYLVHGAIFEHKKLFLIYFFPLYFHLIIVFKSKSIIRWSCFEQLWPFWYLLANWNQFNRIFFHSFLHLFGINVVLNYRQFF